MQLIKNTLLASVAGCALISSSFGAIVASSNITVTASSEAVNGSGTVTRPVTNVINYATLEAPNDETAVYSANIPAQLYHTANGDALPAIITFDFTTAETIDTVFLWNTNNFTGGNSQSDRGVQDFNVELFDSSDVSLGTHDFTATEEISSSTPVIAAQSFSLGGAVGDVSRVIFTLNSNHGDPTFTGFSHAAFGTATIPEPGHFALGFAGIMALAVCLRRRAKKNA